MKDFIQTFLEKINTRTSNFYKRKQNVRQSKIIKIQKAEHKKTN